MKKIILSVILALASASAFATDLVDKSASSSLLTFGVRAGWNSSGQSVSLDDVPGKTNFNWGSGFVLGAVADLNVRNFFSIQPGIFYENRSFDYSVIDNRPSQQMLHTIYGHTRFNLISIPVLASFKFNVSNTVKWFVEAGPYFAFGLGGDDEVEDISVNVSSSMDDGVSNYIYNPYTRDYYGNDPDESDWQHETFHWGLKAGTGLKMFKHFVVGIHYQFGFNNISRSPARHINERSANVTLGFDF